jgi:hypothetical protein
MKFISFILVFLFHFAAAQEVNINYYLPAENYNEKITKPADFLRFQVGERHATHDQVVYYMKQLDIESDRISIEEYALSHEKRPLIALKITSPANHQRIEEIRNEHLKLSQSNDIPAKEIKKQPLVLYLGYSVHGNEASGGNAALLVAYYLAACQSKEVTDLLENTVILLDPCYNPDGFQRFSTWVNMHKGENQASNPANREFNEAWPGGRINHYWFDLNRDWLFLQQPESKGRVAFFQKWKPNVLTDHHEMGSNNTFFFQPGIPSAVNPLIPAKNQELTARIADYHAGFLDKLGVLYYTGESFDDYYAGKGSTYTDLNGCIGILFEQASSRGHLQQTENGPLSFAFTIRNHVTASLSTMKAVAEMKSELMEYQRDFYQQNLKESNSYPIKTYAISCPEDPERLRQFANIALSHGIEIYKPKKDIADNFLQEETILIPLNQLQYKVIRAMFDKPVDFNDSLFYDISTWTMSLAFDLNVLEIRSKEMETGERIYQFPVSSGQVVGGESFYGYLFHWRDFYSPKALNKLLEKGLRVKVSNAPFQLRSSEITFESGSIFVPVQNQSAGGGEIYKWMQEIAADCGIDIYNISTGQRESGIDMGSPSIETLNKASILILVGEGVSPNDAGELWHLLDTRYDIVVNMMDIRSINAAKLQEFNVVLMPDGNYSQLSDTSALLKWVEKGNTLIAFQNAVKWLESRRFINVGYLAAGATKIVDTQTTLPYNSYFANTNSKITNGVILEYKMDLTHPLCYGYSDDKIGLLFQGESMFELPENRYAAPLVTTPLPVLTGYIPEDMKKISGNSAGVIISRKGNGRIISFANNPAFRAIWFGSYKLIANAIFFGHTINSQTAEK